MRLAHFPAPQLIATCLVLLWTTSVLARSTPQADAETTTRGARADSSPVVEHPAKVASPSAERDYLAERRSLAANPDYKPYPLFISEHTLLEEHFKRFNDPSFTVQQADEPLQTLIKAYPLGIRPNLAVAGFLEHVANSIDDAAGPDKDLLEIAAKYRVTAQGVIDSILSTGDGDSAATAWQVINQNEEYSLLEYLHLQPQGQALIFHERGPVDAFTVKASDGTQRKVFFDVSLFFGNSQD
jgi:hypothetical protein